MDLHRLPVLRPGPGRAGPQRFGYAYSIYQAEYSRNLLFRPAGQMEDLFDRVLDRSRSRLDIPTLRTLFGLKNRPTATRRPARPRKKP
jgi:hypothetical protein